METDTQFTARGMRAAREEKVRDRLRSRFGDREFKLSDVLNEIRAEHLRPFKTRDRMLQRGLLTFVGAHVQDQRYIVTDAREYRAHALRAL